MAKIQIAMVHDAETPPQVKLNAIKDIVGRGVGGCSVAYLQLLAGHSLGACLLLTPVTGYSVSSSAPER